MPPPKIQGSGASPPAFKVHQINGQIVPMAHTPMYIWHKYWSRKTWNVVAEHIKAYCPPGGILLDPFAGSGVTAIEAVKNGRRAIACDLLPIATDIARLTIQPVRIKDLQGAFDRVGRKVKDRIQALYVTQCRKCGREFPFTCAVWQDGKVQHIRYEECPKCHDRRDSDCPPTKEDLRLLERIESSTIEEWYPRNRLYYPDGRRFVKKEHYESLDQLFTKRSLQALAWLMRAIEEEPDALLRDFLKVTFTSMVHLCTRMRPEDQPGRRPFSGAGWTQHSYWSAPRFIEVDVWQTFDRAFQGRQSILEAKEDSNPLFHETRIARSLGALLSGKGDAFIHTGDCIKFMSEMPEESVDYIFTDPPYGGSIQFGELAFLWVAWLKKDRDYISTILKDEIVENPGQQKAFDNYEAGLRQAFEGMFRVLKPGAYLTVTFHNPTFKLRNATIRAGFYAGFEFQHIHLQELARPSAKSLLQPFGSAHGDFYMRFQKPVGRAGLRAPEGSLGKFERVIVDAAIRVLAERGEPTPKYILDNFIDPALARNGFFPSIEVEGKSHDVDEILKAHTGKELKLEEGEIGQERGQLWWLSDPSSIKHLEKIPLSERVEQSVVRILREKGKVSFTEALDRVFTEFPNSLTTDTTSVKQALESYAVPRGFGSAAVYAMKPAFQNEARIHDITIIHLAEVGEALGYKVWIGRPEQAHEDPATKKPLSQLVSAKLPGSDNIINQRDAENIDCLWLKGNHIVASFDVEASTPMSEALRRGSGLANPVDRFMVLPDERRGQFTRRMKSPLFKETFESQGWRVLYFGAFKVHLNDLKRGKKSVQEIASIHHPHSAKPSHEQDESLF